MKTRARPLAAAGALLAGLALCAPAAAHGPTDGHLYWANEAGNSIGRADADGANVNQSFIPGATAPRGVAIDAGFVYWTHDLDGGKIGRAALDGSGVPNQSFLTVGSSPQGIALDGARLYWAHTAGSPAGPKIGAANLNGSNQNNTFISASASPCGVAHAVDKIYFANGGSPGSLARAHGSFPDSSWSLTGPNTNNPCGVAVTDTYVYWANRGNNTIGRATLDLSTDVQPAFITTDSPPCGIAVDGAHIYWTTGNDNIARAELDASGQEDAFIPGASDPCGIAVTPSISTTPSSEFFPDTATGAESDIQAFYIANTSSSVLEVSDVSLVGSNAGDFQITGNSCTVAKSVSGSGCIINARFTPTATGLRTASLRVTSNAAGSPIDILLAGTGVTPGTEPGPPSGSGGGPSPSGGGPASPAGGAASDTTAAIISSVAVSPTRWRLGESLAVFSLAPVGTTIRFRLDEDATVTLTFAKTAPGRRVGTRCVRPTRANRTRRRCTRNITKGSLRRSMKAGLRGVKFYGRLSRTRWLGLGRHRVRISAVDKAGNRSRTRTAFFTIVRR